MADAALESLAKISADWWASRLQIIHKREEFAAALARRIVAAAPWGRMFLRVDYDPWDELLEVIREIGIECRGCMYSADGILPMKTSMRIYFDEPRVVVSEGRGGPSHDLDLQIEEVPNG